MPETCNSIRVDYAAGEITHSTGKLMSLISDPGRLIIYILCSAVIHPRFWSYIDHFETNIPCQKDPKDEYVTHSTVTEYIKLCIANAPGSNTPNARMWRDPIEYFKRLLNEREIFAMKQYIKHNYDKDDQTEISCLRDLCHIE